MTTPLVSICIPAYNNRDVIEKTIDSILNQTYTNIELVIVDDNSKDDTYEILKKIDDDRVRILRNEQNLGMVGNWNKCVRETKGELVKLVCADDILVPESIEKEVDYITRDPNIVMTINDSILIDSNDKKIGVFPRYRKKGIIDGRKLSRVSLIEADHFGMPVAVMFKRSVFDEVGGFDEAYHYILDFDLWIRISGKGLVYVIPEKLNCFRLRHDSNTGNVFMGKDSKYYQEHVYLVNKYKDEYSLKKYEYHLSMLSRKLRSRAYSVYMKNLVK